MSSRYKEIEDDMPLSVAKIEKDTFSLSSIQEKSVSLWQELLRFLFSRCYNPPVRAFI